AGRTSGAIPHSCGACSTKSTPKDLPARIAGCPARSRLRHPPPLPIGQRSAAEGRRVRGAGNATQGSLIAVSLLLLPPPLWGRSAPALCARARRGVEGRRNTTLTPLPIPPPQGGREPDAAPPPLSVTA